MRGNSKQDTVRLPELRDDLRITPLSGDQNSYVVEDPLRDMYFRIGPREYRFLCRLGEQYHFTDNEDGDLTRDEATILIQQLAAKQLLKNLDMDTLLHLDQAEQASRHKRKWMSRLNPIIFRVPLFNPDPLLSKTMKWVGWLAGPVFLTIWLLLGALSVMLLLSHWDQFISQSETFFSTRNMLIIGIIWICLKILHELGHSVVCSRHGGRVYEIGILFILFIPLTYVNATSSWSFPNRWQRIQVGAAGMFMELFVAWCAFIYWSTHMDSPSGLIAHHTILVAGVSSLLFNANPLMRFDGYYILSDLVNVPNLYFRGLNNVRQLTDRLLLGMRSQTEYIHHPMITLYGMAVYIWRILVIATLIIIACSLFSGWGLLLAAAALVSIVIQSLGSVVSRIHVYRKQHPRIIFGFLLRSCLLLVICLSVLFGVSYRETINVPAVILFEQQDSVRTQSAGFIERILIHDGDRVSPNQELVVCTNDELEMEWQDVRLRLNVAALQKRQADARGDRAASQILKEQINVLKQKEKNLVEDRDGLTLTAPSGGIVIGDINNLLGTYVSKGQELLQIIGPGGKHVVASVNQNDINALLNDGDKDFDVDMGNSGLGTFNAVLDSISPTASTELEHFAFGAPFGGSLDVKSGSSPSGGNGYEYFNPRFSVYLKLPEELQPITRSGQRATLFFKGTEQSPAMHAWQEIRRWYRSKQPGSQSV